MMSTTRFCTHCVNNDSLIKDLKYDDNGKCHFCAEFPLSSYEPNLELLTKHVSQNKSSSRFDALVLYTGGKDSSFLLWYLSKKLGFKILACMINLPFFQESAVDNARKVVRHLDNVELIERTICWDDAKDMLKTNFLSFGTPCLCVSFAYWFFYPLAVQENIPLFLDGVERGQLQLAQLHYNSAQSLSSDDNNIESARNTTYAELLLHARSVKKTLKKNANLALKNQLLLFLSAIERVKTDGPLNYHFGNMNLKYSRDEMVDILQKELNWKLPYDGQKTLLHTSCKIERVKDYCQLKLYQNNRTKAIPQSISEINSLVRLGEITRDQGLEELADRGFYEEPEELRDLISMFSISKEEHENSELRYIFDY
ncbi:MAG: hypothetical protein LBB91_07135 [Clostridiales bacterium]|nr:hypothetical protein [Clostridiales bacterium]